MRFRLLSLVIVLLMLTMVCGIAAADTGTDSRAQVVMEKAQAGKDVGRSDGLKTQNKTIAGVTNNTIVARIVGPGIAYSNISYIGTNGTIGFFSNGSTIVGISQGVVLSTGEIHNAIGPNTVSFITHQNFLPGDPDLTALVPGYYTYDATVLEFDFKPTTNVIQIQYVFSSDEYNEYVGTSYNDVFGFFVNGKNIAKLPDSTNVSINNVNLGKHPTYYRNNYAWPGPINTEMDGLTTVITSMVSVQPNKLNHIKIAIADAGDNRYDSNVFIKVDSMAPYTGPVIYTIAPAAGTVGTNNIKVTINGDNFYPNTSFTLKQGKSALPLTKKTYLSRTKMTVNVSIPAGTKNGVWNLTAVNYNGKIYQATGIFTVKSPVPVITTIAPTTKVHGTPGFTLNVTGRNFVPGSKIRWNGVAKPTVYISPTKVSATISAADIATAGSRTVVVWNAAPGGGISNSKPFTVS